MEKQGTLIHLRKRYHRHPHAVSMLHAHLVFVTKYRRRVLSKQIFDVVRRQMRDSAHKLGGDITAIESDGDTPSFARDIPPAAGPLPPRPTPQRRVFARGPAKTLSRCHQKTLG